MKNWIVAVTSLYAFEKMPVATRAITSREGEPVSPAYVKLLDRSGEFTAEVVTSEAGEIRFFAGPGEWTVRTLAPRAGAVDVPVTATLGRVTEVEVLV